jgi:hypothetical protein
MPGGSEEETILKEFHKYVMANDPDILVSAEQHYRSSLQISLAHAANTTTI